MEESGVIKGYSILLDDNALGKTITAYITVFMKTTNHTAFHSFLKNSELVTEACRISGEGCYLLKILAGSQEDLNCFLDAVLQYGNYRVNMSIAKIK